MLADTVDTDSALAERHHNPNDRFAFGRLPEA